MSVAFKDSSKITDCKQLYLDDPSCLFPSEVAVAFHEAKNN